MTSHNRTDKHSTDTMGGNLLACMPLLQAHIATLDGIKAVFSAQDFAELGRKRQPHSGAVYVVFDSLAPKQTVHQSTSGRLELTVMVVLVLSQVATSTPLLGQQMTRLIKGITGYRPIIDTKPLTATPFELKGSINAKYIDGFIYLPLSFGCEVLLTH